MHFKLIIALVEDNLTDTVLGAARREGATGSTLINQARGEGAEQAKTFFGLNLETQRDVLLLLVEEHLSRHILETIAEIGAFDEKSGAGIAFQSRDGRLTTSLEWDHVGYSENLKNDPDERIPDADELHLGGEYVFLDRTPVIAVRLGAWLDPDHRIQATIEDDLFSALLPPGDDELHLSAGVGLAFDRFQIDLAADFSDPADTVAVSAVCSF